MAKETIKVPDIGGAENVDVIEVCVAPGDTVAAEDSLVVLESDKASMEIPSPKGGKVVSLKIKEGDTVSQGDPILELEIESSDDSEVLTEDTAEDTPKETTEKAAAPQAPSETPVAAKPTSGSGSQDVKVPDIGGAGGVDVIEVSVAEGDEINEGDSLIVLESDKASMEIPSPASGKILSITVNEGDKVSQGDLILKLEVKPETTTEAPAEEPTPKQEGETASKAQQASAQSTQAASQKPAARTESQADDHSRVSSDVYAGPAVRKLARQLGVQLDDVKATGPRGRMTKDDLRDYVKSAMQGKSTGSAVGAGIPSIPDVDFAQFGEIELTKMSKIKKITAASMSRAWLNVPHVTQFDDADITDLEEFRKAMKAEAEKSGVKLTPLPFLLKACAAALKAEPSFNASMHSDGEHIVQKKYIHIGMAVDTPNGLTVPVIRDVDKKGLFQLAEETLAMAKKAREGKLMPNDMKGGCFTISSLGAIGGTGFTPIVNAPEVAILGVSRASIQPVWDGKEFAPRQMLPLALSYDHRAINGADAGRFFTYLTSVLSDVRRLLV